MPRKKAAVVATISKKRKGDDQQSDAPVKKEKPCTSKGINSEEKVVKYVGNIPIDEAFPEYTNGQYHVYCDHVSSWRYNVMLNQTNIGQNNNKYYVIQVVKHNTKDEYITLCRWGRVGKIAGKSSTKGNLDYAKNEFYKKYKEKTGNIFGYPSELCKRRPGKYDVVDINYGDEADLNKVKDSKSFIPSKLDERVQNIISLIFNQSEWETSVKEMKFDIKKSPLGNLTKSQIKSGFESLKKIEDCLKPGKTEQELITACNEFYTRIPHDFGMKRPPLIRTKEDLKEKIDLIEVLSDIQIAITLLDEKSTNENINKTDAYYNSLQCDLKPIEKDDPEFGIVKTYVNNTHGNTHSYFKLTIEDVFQVNKETLSTKFKKEVGNRMLLWHGSRLTNWCGILRQGLRIAPPEAPVTGYMFGKGVYFADMVSKSAQYCFASGRQPIGLLLICEVALGNMNEKKCSDCNASNLPKGKHSTKGVGRQAPPSSKYKVLSSGEIVPLGKPQTTIITDGWLQYNEYIVYNTSQIKPRYLVKVRFTY